MSLRVQGWTRQWCALAALLLLTGAPVVTAQEVTPADEAETSEAEREAPGGLEEIVVTAERREANLQKLGQAVEAFGSLELEKRGIEDVHGLSFNTPNFVMTSGLSRPSLRGVSNDVIATGVDSGLALHIHNVFVPGIWLSAIFELFDMEAVEVLYGPQGTLYGRATDGGTINYKPKRPTNEFEAWADVELDTLGLATVRGVFNMPLLDEKLALRLAYNREWPQKSFDVHGPPGSGFSQDLETAWSGHGSAYRGSLTWWATDSITVDLFVNYIRNNTSGGAQRFFGRNGRPNAYTPYPTPEEYAFMTGLREDPLTGEPLDPLAAYNAAIVAAGFDPDTFPEHPNDMTPEQLQAVRGFRRSQFGENGIVSWTDTNGFLQTCDNEKLRAAGLGIHNAGTRTPCEHVWGNASPNPDGDWDIRQNRRQSQRYENLISILSVNWEFENFTLTSTTNYQSLDFIIDRDNDYSDLDVWRLILEYTEDNWGQEFLLNGTWGDFDVVAGTNFTYWHQPDLRVPVWNYQSNAEAAEYAVWDYHDAIQAFTCSPEVGAILDFLDPTNAEVRQATAAAACGGPVGAPTRVTGPFDGEMTLLSDHLPLDASIPHLIDIDTETWSWYYGLFGNVTWHVSDRLRLAAGARYSSTRREMIDVTRFDRVFPIPFVPTLLGLGPEDDVRFRARVPFSGAAGEGFVLGGDEYRPRKTWKSLTWTLKAEYDLSDDNMVFVRVSQAEAPGGINYWWFQEGRGKFLDEQTTFAVEAGSKNRFFDDRLQVNLAAFWYQYENKLLSVPTLGVDGIPLDTFDNGPDSRILGGELTVIAMARPELFLHAKVGYLDAEYTEEYLLGDNSLNNQCPIGGESALQNGCAGALRIANLDGNDLPLSPNWTINLGAEYTLHFDWGVLTPRIDWTWKDDYYLWSVQTPSMFQKSFTRTRVALRYEAPDGKYWAELYGNNLEDDTVANQFGGRTRFPSYWLYPRRHYGLKVGTNFF